jgi:hypothetical protein
MPVFELLVFDTDEDFDEVPSTLRPVAAWNGEFPIGLYGGAGIRLSDGTSELVEPNFGRLGPTAAGCRAAAARLREGRAAAIRSSLDNAAAYLVLSADDPVRARIVLEAPPGGAAYPFVPNERQGTEAETDAFLAWLDAETERLLAPTGNAALDAARGGRLRLPRAALIADLDDQAAAAEGLSPS